MDKYEYQVRSEEIKDLIRQKDYAQAAEIADTINWRKVRSVVMLCTVSDVYKMNRRYENAKDLLLMAYEHRPGGRSIVYSLCELCIKTGDLVQAMEYYKEFVNIAPRDPGRYILQYKIYEDQDVSLEERIAVLEELKKHDYREKWAYELAYLYHRVGLETRCVEECDELILWFGDGEYVIKAMELKKLHQPLTPEQQKVYDSRFDPKPKEDDLSDEEEAFEEDHESDREEVEGDITSADTAIWAKEAVTINEAAGDTLVYEPVKPEESEDVSESDQAESGAEWDDEPEADPGTDEEAEVPEISWTEESTEEPEIYVKTMDVSQYNTINLQAELAQELKQLLEQEKAVAEETPAAKTQEFNVGAIEAKLTAAQESNEAMEPEETGSKVVSEAEPEGSADGYEAEAAEEEESGDIYEADADIAEQEEEEEVSGTGAVQTVQPELEDLDDEMPYARLSDEVEDSEVFFGETGEIGLGRTVYPNSGMERKMAEIEPPKEMASVLSQESDGQLRIVLPQNNVVEKQITGQMDIEDVLAEWERMKQANAEKRKEEVRQHVLQQTGSMFTEFEAAVRDGLLEKLEKGESTTVMPAQSLPVEETDEDGEIAEADDFLSLAEELPDVDVPDTEISESAFPELESPEKGEEPFPEFEGFEELEEIVDPSEVEDGSDTVLTMPDEEKAEEPAEAEETAEVEETAEAEETAEVEENAEAEETAEVEENAEAEETAENEKASESGETTEADPESDGEAEDVFEDQAVVQTGAIDYVRLEEQLGGDNTEEQTEGSGEAEEDVFAKRSAVETGMIDYAQIEEQLESDDDGEVSSSAKDEETEESSSDDEPEKRKEKVRSMTREEREHFSAYIQSRSTREQIVKAIDDVSLAAYTGNIILTGEVDVDTIPLAKKLIREVQENDSNFSGRVAKISGHGLNQKSMDETIGSLQNGALIVQNASGMNEQTVQELGKALQRENLGIIVVLQDDTKSMDQFLEQNEQIQEYFTSRIDVKALSNDMLVSYGQRYAREQEFTIDDLGKLALHNRIEKKQTIDHAVTMTEVKEIVDEAIRHAKRPGIGHFVDILVGKRYDEEDMIIITEKDFK